MISNTAIPNVPTSATFLGWLNGTNLVQQAVTSVVLTADTGNAADPFSGANTIPTVGVVTHNGVLNSTTLHANTISGISGNLTFVSTTVILDSASNLSVGGSATFSNTLGANSITASGNTTVGNFSAGNSSISGTTFSPGQLECGNTTANVNLTVYGDAEFLGNVSGFQNLSDPRLKENPRAVDPDELSNLSNLNVWRFDWKKEAPMSGSSVGVMADDVEKILPELVHVNSAGYKEVDYVKLVPYLLLKIQKLENEVEFLKVF